MRMTARTAVNRMDRPFFVTDRITVSSVSTRYMMSSSWVDRSSRCETVRVSCYVEQCPVGCVLSGCIWYVMVHRGRNNSKIHPGYQLEISGSSHPYLVAQNFLINYSVYNSLTKIVGRGVFFLKHWCPHASFYLHSFSCTIKISQHAMHFKNRDS